MAAVKCCVRKAHFFRCPGRLWNGRREAPGPCVGFNTTKGKTCSVFCFPIPSLSALLYATGRTTAEFICHGRTVNLHSCLLVCTYEVAYYLVHAQTCVLICSRFPFGQYGGGGTPHLLDEAKNTAPGIQEVTQ